MRAPEEKSLAWVALELVVASFIVLFQELTLIRWVGGQVRVIAYFPNLVLIAAFLGLGLGCLRSGARSLLWLWPVSVGFLVVTAIALGQIAFTHEAASEFLFLLYYDVPNAPIVPSVRIPIVWCFVVVTISFVPLGQLVAERLRIFRERSSALWGYCFDLLGSLLGVVAFAIFAFLHTFPLLWFAVFLAAGFLFFASSPRGRVLYLAAGVGILIAIASSERASRYSPYYALSHTKSPSGVHVLTNGSLHQVATHLRRERPVSDDWVRLVRTGYHFPYRSLLAPPKRVLVLGAGTGNDVSVALDEGAERVDAVEIDPMIVELGKQLHPDRPYADPRVRVINNDARSYLNETEEKYDLIVFGTLDSMTRLSALSNVRLDNFVYTRECLEAARRRLADGGGLVMYFMAGTDYIRWRLIGLVAGAFQDRPVIVSHHFGLFNIMLMAGPAFTEPTNMPRPRQDFLDLIAERIEMSTDDWPYLYLRARGIGSFYLTLIGSFLLFGVIGLLFASEDMRLSLARRRSIDGEMFLFGLGFLLLETKSVTQINLLWGATWLTSAVVFAAILLMMLLATVLMQLRPISRQASMVGLVATLLISYSVPTDWLLSTNWLTRLGLSILLVGSPIFFASVSFAVAFARRKAADLAFGWNLLGAVAGGFLEFGSMSIGLRALSLVALCAYLGTVLLRASEVREGGVGVASPDTPTP